MLKNIEELTLHEATGRFPMASEEEMANLERDIAENGILEPVKVVNDEIIDGRHRFMAARRLKMTEIPIEVVEVEDIESYVLSLNLKRRMLNAGQKAIIAYEHLGVASDLENSEKKRRKGKLSVQVADIAGIGETTAKELLYVVKNGDKNDIELIRSGNSTTKMVKKDIQKRNKSTNVTTTKSTTPPLPTPSSNNLTTSQYAAKLASKDKKIEALEAKVASLQSIIDQQNTLLLQMEGNSTITTNTTVDEVKEQYIKDLEKQLEEFKNSEV